MAVLAVAGAGAAAGVGIGAAAGVTGAGLFTAAGIGWTVGTIAGQLLFPPKHSMPNVQMSTSTYGRVIPTVKGTVRVPGNIIWAMPLKSRKSGKGGLSGPTTYSYSGTFAISFCRGPMAKVLRIWADNTCIYDIRSGVNVVRAKNLNFRFYPGDELQDYEPLIAANPYYTSDLPGYDPHAPHALPRSLPVAPAFRGQCYIVFQELPLKDYGNRIPNIHAELAEQVTDRYVADELTLMPGETSLFSSHPSFSASPTFDYKRNVMYMKGEGPQGIRRFDLTTLTETRQVLATDIWPPECFTHGYTLAGYSIACGPDGALYAGSWFRISRIDANVMKETHHFDGSGFSYYMDDTTFPTLTWMCPARALTSSSTEQYLFLASRETNAMMVLNGEDMTHLWHGRASLNQIAAVTPGKSTLGVTEFWALCFDYISYGHPTTDAVHLDIVAATPLPAAGTLAGSTTLKTTIPVNPGDIEAGATQFLPNAGGLVYDAADDSVVFHVGVCGPSGPPGRNYLVKYHRDGHLVWATQPAFVSYSVDHTWKSQLNGGIYTMIWPSQGIVQVNAATGEQVYHADGLSYFSGNFTLGGGIFDGITGDMFVCSNLGPWYRIHINRQTGDGVTIGEIVGDLCQQAGLASTDCDTSSLSQAVVGYYIDRNDSAAQLISELGGAFLFDCSEIEGQLTFTYRGGPIVTTISEDQMVRDGATSAEAYKLTHAQEIDLPFRVTLTYFDITRDYEASTQTATRPRRPNAVMFSDNTVAMNLSMVLWPDGAKQFCEMALYSSWRARDSYAFTLPPGFLWLTTADPITLSLNNGRSVRVRIVSADIGVDYSTRVTAVTEWAAVFTNSAVGADPPFVTQAVQPVVQSRLLLLDTPLLRDADENPSFVVGYWTAGPYVDAAWAGAELYRSGDAAVWSDTGDAAVAAAAWGYLVVPPADPASYFRTQRTGTMRVDMVSGGGELASVTDLQLWNGANACAILKHDGDVEIVQFRDVTQVSGTLYDLSWLLRGRRGTDTMGGGFAGGETVVMLSSATTNVLDVGLSARGAGQYYRAVTVGQLVEDADTVPEVFHGRDKMPYAPVHVAAALSGGDITLSWVRRTRLYGGLYPGTGTAPLGEASEAYEVDILSAPGGTVLRTLSGLSSPVATYREADIAADFGSTPASLSVVVYQVSATVGRGFGRAVTLEVS